MQKKSDKRLYKSANCFSPVHTWSVCAGTSDSVMTLSTSIHWPNTWHTPDFRIKKTVLYLLGDEVQGQDVLRQGEVDLEDLLLDRHGELGLVRHQLGRNSVTLLPTLNKMTYNSVPPKISKSGRCPLVPTCVIIP